MVVNPANVLKNPNDPNTRVVLFVLNLELFVGETPAAVTINLIDVNKGVHNLPANTFDSFRAGMVLLR